MNYNKIRAFCSPFRIVLGIALIAYAVYSKNNWYFLGAIPLIAGLTKFCPICIISKKCDI